MALLDRDGVYGAPRFHLAAKKIRMRAHIGAEVTSAEGWRYPLLVESRAGYQNLCRLITRMKLRARKGRRPRFAGRSRRKDAPGLICLTGGEEGPLAHALARGGIEQATECVRQLCEHIRPRKCLRRIAAAFLPRRRSAQPGGGRNRAQIASAAAGHQRRLPRAAAAARSARRLHLHSPSPHARNRRAPAGAQFRAPSEIARGDGSALFSDLPEAIANTQILSSRLQFTLKDLGYEFPKYPVPDGESQMHFLRERTREGMISRYGRRGTTSARAQADRARTGADRKARSGRLFPDRLGHRALLPRAQYSGAGARLGGQ